MIWRREDVYGIETMRLRQSPAAPPPPPLRAVLVLASLLLACIPVQSQVQFSQTDGTCVFAGAVVMHALLPHYSGRSTRCCLL